MTDKHLVTGGAGFIGSNIVRSLLDEGADVRVLDNFSTGRRANLEDVADHVDLIEGDLRDEQAVRRAVDGVRFVFHLAALPSVMRSVADPMTTNEVNVSGTLRLLLAARDAGVERLVFSSSSSVYGDTPTLPKREDMTPSPLSPYALSKLAGEHYAAIFSRLYGLDTFALRYFNVFGPRQDPHSQYAAVIPLFIDAFSTHQSPTVFGDGEQTRDFTFVENVVAANLCCRTAPKAAAGQAYNVACGERVSVNELARRVALLTASKASPVYEAARAGEVRDSQADNTRAREALGWAPGVSFQAGLERTVSWFLGQAR